MKKFIVFALALVLVIGFASVSFAAISTSKHDLSTSGPKGSGNSAYGAATTQICVFCHHPHRGEAGAGDDQNGGEALLWNMGGFAVTTYDTYASTATMNEATAAVDSNAPQSFLCMACHDGVISGGSLIENPGDGNDVTYTTLVASANLGTTLVNDHPVNMTYSDADTGLAANTATAAATDYVLFSGKMQCATCHDVHAGTTSQSNAVQFMRGNTVGSKICVDCHVTK